MKVLNKQDLFSFITAKGVAPLFLEMGNHRLRRFLRDTLSICPLPPSINWRQKSIESDELRKKLTQESQKHDAFSNAYTTNDEWAFAVRAFLMAIAYPEYIFPLGYNEFRICSVVPESIDVDQTVKGAIAEAFEEKYGKDQFIQTFLTNVLSSVQYRKFSGVWHTLEGVFDQLLPSEKKLSLVGWKKGMLENWGNFLEKIQLNQSQKIWCPSTDVWFKYDSESVRERVDILIRNLAEQRVSLRNIHWRQLEELVAELLRCIGLKVMLTKKTHDGGRDIIATGELIPGEPTTLAVEVKHKDVVGVADLRAALYANRDFPALLFATSGKFSAGIFREQRENQMRLFLKDGVALQQWLNTYALPNQALSADAKKPRG